MKEEIKGEGKVDVQMADHEEEKKQAPAKPKKKNVGMNVEVRQSSISNAYAWGDNTHG